MVIWVVSDCGKRHISRIPRVNVTVLREYDWRLSRSDEKQKEESYTRPRSEIAAKGIVRSQVAVGLRASNSRCGTAPAKHHPGMRFKFGATRDRSYAGSYLSRIGWPGQMDCAEPVYE